MLEPTMEAGHYLLEVGVIVWGDDPLANHEVDEHCRWHEGEMGAPSCIDSVENTDQ